MDTDVHTSGPMHPAIAKDVIQYLDEPYKSYLDPDVQTFGSPYPGTGHGISIPGKVQGVRHEVTDPEEHINKMLCEEFGVDYPIINTIARLDMVPDTERIYPEARAVNNMILDRFLDEHDHFFGLATVPMREPHKTAEEIDRIGDEDQIVGIFIHPGGQERGLGDPRYDPIYKAAQDNDLAVAYHGTGSGLQWEAPGISKGLSKYMEVHVLEHPWSMMWTLTSLVTNGVFEKFPDLNFAFLESGIGWVPYMMHRLNREYGQRRSEAPLLEKSPEKYIRESCYFATQPLGEPDNPSDLQHIIEAVGAECMVFATDHPHYDFDNPEFIDRYLKNLPQEDYEKVFHKNAIEAFNLPI